MHTIDIPEDYALVLQQVDEAGQEDFTALAESLSIDRARLLHIVDALKNKGLVSMSHPAQDTWISLSARGRRLINRLWPESHMRYSY